MADDSKRCAKEVEARKREQLRSSQMPFSAGGSTAISHSEMSSIYDSESEAEKRKRTRGRDSPEDKAKKKKKTQKSDGMETDEEEDEDENLDDALENLKNVLNRMRSWWAQPALGSKISKPQTAKFARYMDRFQEEIIRAKEERARIETKVMERAEVVEIVRRTVKEEIRMGKTEVQGTATTRYSDVTKRNVPKVPPVTGMKRPVVQAPKQVIVRHENKESEEVKATLKRLVRPSEIGLKVRRLVNIRNGVIIEAESEEGVESLTKNEDLKKAGLKMERPEKKKPVIMVYDVCADLKDDEIRQEVYGKNMRDSQIPEEEFKQEFEVRHKYKDVRSGGKKVHIVVESSVRVRNWLRGREKIFIEWQCCRVKDYVDVARCYKCQKFGHVAKHCSSEKASCSYCAGEHEFKNCPDKNNKEKVCCINCKKEKRENVKHDAGSRKCPAYERAVKRTQEKIDYGV